MRRCSQLGSVQEEDGEEAGDAAHSRQVADAGALRHKKQAGQHVDPAKAVRSAAKARVRTAWLLMLAGGGHSVQVLQERTSSAPRPNCLLEPHISWALCIVEGACEGHARLAAGCSGPAHPPHRLAG